MDDFVQFVHELSISCLSPRGERRPSVCIEFASKVAAGTPLSCFDYQTPWSLARQIDKLALTNDVHGTIYDFVLLRPFGIWNSRNLSLSLSLGVEKNRAGQNAVKDERAICQIRETFGVFFAKKREREFVFKVSKEVGRD